MALWGITTFFNPTGAERRLTNYRRFREHSARQNLPLLTIEQVFPGSEAVLREGPDAERLLVKHASAVLWQKERLLNLGLAALPRECTGVCWIDADVLFEDDDWVAQTEALLREYVVVQPFAAAVRLPAAGTVEEFPGSAVGRTIPEGTGDATFSASLGSKLGRWPRFAARFAGTTGYVWSARRSLLDAVGFYDRCIVGGGDREFALAIAYAPGKIPSRQIKNPNPRLRADLSRWHARIYPLVGEQIGYRPGVIHHLWHGSSEQRGYVDRHAILIEHGFDPERDIVLDSEGCWAWAPGRDALAKAVADYFDSRRDAG